MKKRISIYICVMMLAFSFAGCTSEQSEKKPEIELQQIKSIGEFAVLECYYHNVAKSDTMKKVLWWNTDRRLWIEYTGIVKAGVDIDKIDMKVDGNTLTISLPKAEILSCKVD